MTKETRKMLDIINKQQKEAYAEIVKENKKRKIVEKIISICELAMFITTVILFITVK